MFIKKYIYILILLLSISIIVRGQKVTDMDLDKPVKSFHINEKINPKQDEAILKTIVIDYFVANGSGTLKFHDIDSIQYRGTYKLKNTGKILVFQIYFSYDLPCSWYPYQIVLLIDNTNQKGYLLGLHTVFPIKVKHSDDNFYFAGIYKNKYQYGTFKIFDIKNGVLYNIFASDEAVSNYSLDCISYENDELQFQNIDVNHDGYLDLVFTGIKNYYCEGYESYGREDRPPIKQEKVSIIYYCFTGKNILGWKNNLSKIK